MQLIGETHTIDMQIGDVNDGDPDHHTAGGDGTLGGDLSVQNKYYLVKSGDEDNPSHITARDGPNNTSYSSKKLPVGSVIKGYPSGEYIRTPDSKYYPMDNLETINVGAGTKVVLTDDRAGTISHSVATEDKGEMFVLTMNDGSPQTVEYKEIKAKLGKGHVVKILSGPFAGQIGRVANESTRPEYVSVVFPNIPGMENTPQDVAVEDLQILPRGNVSDNMTGSGSGYNPSNLSMPEDWDWTTIAAISAFVVVLLFAILVGLYLLTSKKKRRRRRRDTMEELEAGERRIRVHAPTNTSGRRRSNLDYARDVKRHRKKSRRERKKSKRNDKQYLSGKELQQAESAMNRQPSNRTLSVAPRQRSESRRRKRRKKSRRS